jgi:predicted esterase
VIWFHGLGDTRIDYWSKRFATLLLPYIGKAHFIEPRAPLEHVSASPPYSDPLPSWFDVLSIPVRAMDGEGRLIADVPPKGLGASVAHAHALADRLIADGIPADKIIFGGFSQGGALAIEAGTTYARRCAGVVSISGWWPSRRWRGVSAGAERAASAAAAANTDAPVFNTDVPVFNTDVPVFFSSGTSDPVVDYNLSKASCDALAQVNSKVQREVVQRGKHPPSGREMAKAAAWMLEQLRD